MEIRHIREDGELASAFVVMKELRPHLTSTSFFNLYRHAHDADGYVLAGIFDKSECIALIGYRILYDFVHGKHLYVDDLVSTGARRSEGMGSKLLAFAEKEAIRIGCRGMRICTGLENDSAKRLYEKEGWEARSLAYKKVFHSDPW